MLKTYIAGGLNGDLGKWYWDKIMDLYLAAANEGSKSPMLERVNLLESFYYIKDWQIPLIHKCKSFILDSGAFSFMMQPKVKIDWDKYLEKYADFINKNKIDLFFELDIDTIIGVDKTKILRAKLERLTNKQPIWVLQKGRTLANYKSACKDYPYVALSLSGKTALSKARRKMIKELNILCDIAHSNNSKIHGLGFTDNNLKDYKFDSVDSTAWIYGNRGGFLYKFNGKMMMKIDKPAGTRLKSKEVAIHNFWEWVKYSEYLEGTNLFQAGTSTRDYVLTSDSGGGTMIHLAATKSEKRIFI